MAEDQYLLALVMHHIIVDGWSVGILLQANSTHPTANTVRVA